MKERTGLVTMKGQSLTLLGNQVRVGQKAPDFEVVANDLTTVRFSSFLGKVCIISSVPSLDTAVCDTMTRRFNVEAGSLGEEVVVITISMDFPLLKSDGVVQLVLKMCRLFRTIVRHHSPLRSAC